MRSDNGDAGQGARLWEVVGGAANGGILVREEKHLKSKEVDGRLATGSLVRQLDLADGRLRFLRLTGSGPNVGWVSLKLKDKPLIEESSKVAPDLPVLACFYSGGFTAEQGRYRLHPFLEAAEQAGFADTVVLDHVGEPGYEDCKDWDDYVSRMAAQLDEDPKHHNRPVVIFAHSHGTTPAWGLARQLGSRCLKFYCACKRPPNQGLTDEVWGVDTAAKVADLDVEFMFTRLLDAWPNSVLEQFRMKRPLNPMVQHTMEVVKQQYGSHVMPCGSAENRIICGDGDTIGIPILAFAATEERPMGETAKKMEGWRELTTGSFDLRMLEGAHMDMLGLQSPLYPAVLADLQGLVQAMASADAARQQFTRAVMSQDLGVPPQASPCKDGQEMLAQQRWAVVGRGSNDIVQRLLRHLASHERTYYHVDPYGASGPDVPKSLAELGEGVSIDVVDLCANPKLGEQVIEDCKARGINNVFIQPGAASPEILESCNIGGIAVHQGCILVEMM